MSDNTYKFVALLIQGLGLIAIVFYFGRYVGESTSMFKTLFKNQSDLKEDYDAHVMEDNIRHMDLSKSLADVRVEVAKRR